MTRRNEEGKRERCAIVLTAFALVFCVSRYVFASGGAYTSTKHADATNGVYRIFDEPKGDCTHCHDQHASRDGNGNGGPFGTLLFGQNDNTLCITCHGIPGANAIWPGNVLWQQSSHATSPSMYWPGPTPPARSSSDANKCLNCHTPHGAIDANGVIPSMNTVREEGLCQACHNGSRATTDVTFQFTKAYKHPIATSGRHAESEGNDPAKFAATPTNNRHSECVDCHNPHRAQYDAFPPNPPDASARLAGVSRIQVTNGLPGVLPIYTWRAPDDTSPAREYEFCFKCHSSWTRQPVGQTDFALQTNPQNPSYHPIQATGKNRNIDPNAFVNGWTWDRIVYCSDCHTSDDPTVRGPHGSTYQYILKKQTTASPLQQTMPATDICFDCHSYAVYADSRSSTTVQSASRFNLPTNRGHAFHVGQRNLPCYACHVTHGSSTLPTLIITGRSPGSISFIQTATGGTCVSTCHTARTYTVNYPR